MPSRSTVARCRSCGCQAVAELHGRRPASCWRALGIGLELAPREEVDLLIVGAGPAGSRPRSTAPLKGSKRCSRGHGARRQAGSSRRIENYLGFPAGISGTELTSRAVTQARKFNARTPRPTARSRSNRETVGISSGLEEDREVAARAVLLATGAQYRRLPVDRLAEFEGTTVFYAAGPPEGQLCAGHRVAVVGGGNSAGQAAVWLARGGALVTLLHRRDSLAETMSDYLIHELERYGVSVRDRSENCRAPWRGRVSRRRHAHQRRCASLLIPVPVPRAHPCTDCWATPLPVTPTASSSQARSLNMENLLETDIPGVFAAGDVRSGSSKRCATAVGEGSMAVQFVHAHLARTAAVQAAR